MGKVLIGRTMWETGAPRFTPLIQAKPPVADIRGRTAALLALAGTLAATTLISTPKAEQTPKATPFVQDATKDPVRLAAWEPRREPATPAPSPVHPSLAEGVFSAALAASPARFQPFHGAVAATSLFQPWTPLPAEPVRWIDGEFSEVTVVDGRTLQTGGLRIRLAGLDLPIPEQMCRTLDARFEPCANRAATQLDLLTRHRTIACRYRLERAGEAVGECRIGTSDLVERLVRTGYVWRTAALATGATR